MIRLVLLVLILAAAMWFGPLLVNNAGYVKVIVAGKVFETTLLGLTIVFLAVISALWLLVVLLRKLMRLQHLSFNFLKWRRQRKAQQAFELGLEAYAKQQWHSASQYLQQACADDFMAPQKHLIAAYAAFYAGDSDKANRHAQQLQQTDAGLFLQADLLLQQAQPGQACALLAERVQANTQDQGLGQLRAGQGVSTSQENRGLPAENHQGLRHNLQDESGLCGSRRREGDDCSGRGD